MKDAHTFTDGSLGPSLTPEHRKKLSEAARAWRRRGGARVVVHQYRYALDAACSRCGFVPEDLCQLDVDHIDRNRSNNARENLQTLCANCHRLKTKRERNPGQTYL